jgi:general secretion pathway protein H
MRTSRPSGFTLIELLIVIALVGILAGTVIVSLGSPASGSRQVDAHVTQLINRIELARRFALQRNREWGLDVDPEELRFLEWDPYQARWATQRKKPFEPIAALDALPFSLEEEEGRPSPEGSPEQPDIILFSSGEITPFTLWLGRDRDVQARAIESDGLSPVTPLAPAQ